jgi:hypothetical protein
MDTSRTRRPALLGVVAVVTLLGVLALAATPALAAPDLVVAQEDQPSDTTEPAEPTPPDTEEPEEDDEGFGASGIALIIVAVVALILIFLAGRGSSRSAAPVTVVPQAAVPPAAQPPPPPTPQPEEARRGRLRSAYSATRSVLDRLDTRSVELRVAAAAGDEDARAADRDLRRRIEAALSDLYGLEAEAATASERTVLRETADALNALDRAIGEAAKESAPGEAIAAVGSVRDRLDTALDGLAAQIRGLA